MNIGLLGLGKMGSAILKGLLDSDLTYNIGAYSHHSCLLPIKCYDSEEELYENSDIFIFCIKPQNFPEVIEKLKSCRKTPKILVSIAAGIKIDYLINQLGVNKVVRLMPNTACASKKGVITMATSKEVSSEDITFVKSIFETIGSVYSVTEEEINKLLPLNGSFPAYFYYFINSFVKASMKQGISAEMAREIILKTILGSTDLALKETKSLDQMISDVCSKKGTTIEGVMVFDEENIQDTIEKCYNACLNRAIELEK